MARLAVLAALVSAVVLAQTSVAQGQGAARATLTVLRGVVSVVSGDGSAVSPAPSGLTLNAGDRVATVGRAAALVTFFEGSEVELGADTTVGIQALDGSRGGQVSIVLENVLGSTLHRIVTLTDPGSSYRIEAGGTVALVRGTTLGHRVDGAGNITVYLINSTNTVTFPNTNNTMSNGEICTYTAKGDLMCGHSSGGDPWSLLANGDQAGNTGGTNSSGQSNTKKEKEKDQDENPSQATATPTRTPTPTPTPSLTPTATPTEEFED